MATNGISKLDLKRQNRMQILKLLRNAGPTSRIDIARNIGITKAAVTIITNEMIEQGIIYEKGEQLPKGNKIPRGRKKILLDVNPTYKMGMGLVIDSGRIYFGLCTLKGDVVEKHVHLIGAEDTAEDIFAAIEKLYQDVVYKNDLKDGLVAGMGVCVQETYYGTLMITRKPDGMVDYHGLEERLSVFADVPMTFGSLVDGIATAEIDFTQNYEESLKNILVCRYASHFDCAVSIGQELYRGSHGRALDLAHLKIGQDEECHQCGRCGCAAVVLSQERLWEQLREMFSSEQTPMLWEQSAGTFQKAKELLQQPEYVPQDEAIVEQIHSVGDACLSLLRQMMFFYDPDRVILFGEGEAFEPLTGYILEQAQKDPSFDDQNWLIRSKITTQNVFLAAASLATREFFINKGGF